MQHRFVLGDDQQIVKNLSFDLGVTIKPGAGLSLALVGNNLNGSDSVFQPLTLGGAIGLVKGNFGIEADVVSDLVTWNENKLRAMLGAEILFGDHVLARGGYRYDQGAESHSGSLGLGYIDKTFSVDAAARRVLVGDAVTAVILTFSYHVEASGLTPTPSETW